jgi:predicted RNase H-like nuclease (RuvC/YqgF family)
VSYRKTDLCKEREARQKAERELDEANKALQHCADLIDRLEAANKSLSQELQKLKAK